MRAVVLTGHGGPGALQVQERPSPACGAGQVRIAVAAAGVNFADLMATQGLYPDAPKTPCVVGYEVAGTVIDRGDGVQALHDGQRVIAATRFGGYAEEVVVPAGDAFALPDGMSFEQGAALPVNYGTAYAGLVRYGALREGERVLIHAAAGGVGIAATQIARHHGAEVWGTASASKHEAIRGFGVEHPIDYRQAGWQRGLPKFDVVMDAIGGRSFRISYDLLRAGGRLVAFGASSVVSGEKRNLVQAGRAALSMPRFNMIKQMSASKAVIGLNLLTLWDELGTLAPFIAPVQEMLAAGAIAPVVSDAIPFERAADAHRILSERRNVGKVVLVP
ncbi:MAG TPA: zinc-binding dehydrogenase [Solirubrobacteraceae bacterium]|nr:zinc-binding dehydrogenase [Solirubrobacteraceae bacterium]